MDQIISLFNRQAYSITTGVGALAAVGLYIGGIELPIPYLSAFILGVGVVLNPLRVWMRNRGWLPQIVEEKKAYEAPSV